MLGAVTAGAYFNVVDPDALVDTCDGLLNVTLPPCDAESDADREPDVAPANAPDCAVCADTEGTSAKVKTAAAAIAAKFFILLLL